MAEIEPRMVFATDIFIREMKRQWMRQHPTSNPLECPVRILEQYHPTQRLALIASISKAVEATTGMEETYIAWIQMKTSGQGDQQAA